MSRVDIAVVGAGHAGGRVVQHLCSQGYTGSITLIGEEPHHPYERPALSKELLLGLRSVADIMLAEAPFWESTANVRRRVARVLSLDAEARSLSLSTGETLSFDILVIATGGAPRRLPVTGGDLPGLHYLRTLDDCATLREAMLDARSLTIIGAGVIGMEAAASASQMGLKVNVLEADSRVMARCVPAPVSEWLATQHRAHGVALHLASHVTGLQRAPAGASRYRVEATDADGQALAVNSDLVLIAVGIECESGFVADAGLEVDNGVLVDEYCRSVNASWCYAVGDIARTFNPVSGLYVRQETWRNAENQAQAVATLIMGGDTPYQETPWMWTDQFGNNVQVVGIPRTDDHVIVRGDMASGKATLVHLREGRVVGGVMINQGRDRRTLESMTERGQIIDFARLSDPALSLKQVAA